MKTFLAFAFLLAGAMSNAQSVFGDSNHAFALMPSEVISSGVCSQVTISGSGRLILFQRKVIDTVELESKSTPSWYVYDRVTKTTKKLGIPPVQSVIAMYDDNHVVFMGIDKYDSSGILNLKTGAIVPLDLAGGYIAYPGTKSFGPFILIGNRTTTMRIVSPEGKSSTVTFPENLLVTQPVAADDQNIYFHAMVEHAKRRLAMRLTFNRSTGQVTQRPYASSQEESKDLGDDGLGRRFSFDSRREATVIRYHSFQTELSIIKPEALVGPPNALPDISSQNDFVVYQDAGSLLLREIRQVDSDLAKKLSVLDERKKLVIKARQVGTAILAWAGDHDDDYPGQGDFPDGLGPYIKDRDILKDFNYTYKGGNASSLENPSSTELGFMVADGGRVVVYADGHSKFVPNP